MSAALTMRVFVTDGNSRAALAVTRSLGRAGHEVWVGERASPSLAQSSKHCAHAVTCPDPVTDGAAFREALLQCIRDAGIDVLLPITDVAAALVLAERDRFDAICLVPMAKPDVVDRASDKVRVLRMAERLGVPTPRTWILESAEDVTALLPILPYPVVLKAHRSRISSERGWLVTSVGYADTPEILARRIAARDRREFPLILQERITGPGVGAFFCLTGGRIVAEFSHRRLREKPPSGGVSVFCESTAIDPAIRTHGEMLLRELGWEGVAMVEFKRDLRDGVAKLMEINGRFWGSLQLAIDAGVDFPAILLQPTTPGAHAVPAPQYRVGLRSRWFWGDVDALLISLFSSGERAAQDRRLRSRLSAVFQFFKLWYPGLRYENPRLDDLGPFWHETRQWFARAFRRQRAAVPAQSGAAGDGS